MPIWEFFFCCVSFFLKNHGNWNIHCSNIGNGAQLTGAVAHTPNMFITPQSNCDDFVKDMKHSKFLGYTIYMMNNFFLLN